MFIFLPRSAVKSADARKALAVRNFGRRLRWGLDEEQGVGDEADAWDAF